MNIKYLVEEQPLGTAGALSLLPESMNDLPTVSYTHLRAHETVLDLVCRLLLEKKTTTNPNAI